MENISNNITYKEATRTSSKFSNVPDEQTLLRMKNVASKLFEPVREWYKLPIQINSFYRSPKVNKSIGGSATSQHVKGEAIDIDTKSIVENKKIFNYIKDNLKFDQLIWENNGEWIHISLKMTGTNRQQVLSINK